MRITIEDKSYYVGTGGKPFDSELPTVVFLHGTGMDHRAWALQTRWFAFHGYNVLAPDFPGHSLSEGKCPESIEDSAVWLEQMLDHLKVAAAHIVGHSQGFLSALEFAANSPKRVISLVGVGTAAAIPVNPALIKTAYESAFDAAKIVTIKIAISSSMGDNFANPTAIWPTNFNTGINAVVRSCIDTMNCAKLLAPAAVLSLMNAVNSPMILVNPAPILSD